MSITNHAIDRFVERFKMPKNQAIKCLKQIVKNKKDGRHKFIYQKTVCTYVMEDNTLVTIFQNDKISKIDRLAKQRGLPITPFIRIKK